MIDSHCHLDMFEDLGEVLDRARERGIRVILTVAADEGAFVPSLHVASQEGIYVSLGVHPHYAREAKDDTFRRLLDLASHPKVVAIGETGLDFYRDLSPRWVQEDCFRRHIELANRAGLPLVLHCREAYDRALEILDDEGGGEVRGVVHCFSADRATAEEFLKRGFFISFSGTLTYPKAEGLREVAEVVPLDRVLLETDAPYLPPQPYRGKRNEPAYVVETLKAFAEIRGLDQGAAEEALEGNFFRIFEKAGGEHGGL